MKITNAKETTQVVKTSQLGKVAAGEIFRFPNVKFEEAIIGHDEATFYMVINKQPAHADRVSIMSIDGKTVLERDADREVVVHQAELFISDNA